MARSRASTAAGRRRATARAGQRAAAHPRGGSSSKAAPKRSQAKAPRKPAKRAAGAPPKRRPPKRSTRRAQRRQPSRSRARSSSRDGFSWRQRLVLLLSLGAVLTAGYLFWLRDSSLVAVNDVEVAGVSTDREAIVAELTRVGEGMTTLHVDAGAIERAAAAFPTIESVTVDPNFPHGLRIEVTERPPAVVVQAGGEEIPAAADGTLLGGVEVPEDELPEIVVDQVPGGRTLTGEAREQAVVAGAVPEDLRPFVEDVASTDDHGVEVTLRGGIPVYFGAADDAPVKWAAAAAVLADPELDYARCVDVRIPARPAVCQDNAVTEPAPANSPA